MTTSKPNRVWTLADAQANLAELLRLADREGPQYIGADKTFVVSPAEPEHERERMPLGQWLVNNMPRGTNLVIPDDEHSEDEIPWTDEADV